MSSNNTSNDARFDALKDESARQRWQLFHRAIAHAKQSNNEAMEADGSPQPGEPDRNGPNEPGRPESRLSIAR